MPIYEYTCRKCKAHVEALQKITDKPLVKCKKCGGRLEKEWSQTGFQFKGSGWYVTDYARKGSGGKDEAAESKSDAKSESKSETKAESKAESKAENAPGEGAKKTPKAKPTSKGASTD